MWRTGKQKFVCKRVVTCLNTLQTKTESYLENLGIISFEDGKKRVLIFNLIFEFTLYVPFLPKVGSGSNK